jgi:hypothetical protein
MMTTMKRKKRKFDPLFDFFRHPLFPSGHLTSVRLTIALLGALLGLICVTSPARTLALAGDAQSSSASHAHDFVIFANVFNNQSFALVGARARVRREEEKKFRWEAASDHQGEFGIRVPRGAEYELMIEARGFKTQTRKIDAREGSRTDLTIRMEP